jgi:3-deoxy-7-phosphoheptulonate synthase
VTFKYITKLPEVDQIISDVPLSKELQEIKAAKDVEIKDVFTGKSDKFVLIIGPCSADQEDSVCDYVNRLGKLQEKVSDRLILIPRIYTNKPRTTGEGYKGMMHQPNPSEAPNITEGIKSIRKMHVRALNESHLSAADEMLYPGNYPYLEDLLGYVAIGARSVENQQHRLTISGLDIPSGMKNPTSGDKEVMINSVLAAQIPHNFIYNNWEVETSGNALTHTILRGAFNQYGQSIPNYYYEDLMNVVELYSKRNLANPGIIVDTNHANSGKIYKQQFRIAKDVIHSRKQSSEIKTIVKGLMIESYIEEGNQKIGDGVYGKSITDPCIGWADTEELVLWLADKA